MRVLNRPRLFAGIAVAVLFPSGTILAQDGAQSLASAVDELTREWYAAQTAALPADDLPARDDLIIDIADMRDDVIRRVSDVLATSDALADGVPDDAANAAAMTRLVEAYQGLERATPIFTQLALSKANDPAYRSGWRLCAIRVIAETWLPQAELVRAQRETSALQPCENGLEALQMAMPPLEPPRTEYDPGGSAVMEFTVAPTGVVSNVWFVNWSVTPNDGFMLDYVTRSVQAWQFPPRESSCRLQRTITFETAGAE